MGSEICNRHSMHSGRRRWIESFWGPVHRWYDGLIPCIRYNLGPYTPNVGGARWWQRTGLLGCWWVLVYSLVRITAVDIRILIYFIFFLFVPRRAWIILRFSYFERDSRMYCTANSAVRGKLRNFSVTDLDYTYVQNHLSYHFQFAWSLLGGSVSLEERRG